MSALQKENYLKKCPFCGHSELEIKTYDSVIYVHCMNCHALGPFVDDEGKGDFMARRLWNTRKK